MDVDNDLLQTEAFKECVTELNKLNENWLPDHTKRLLKAHMARGPKGLESMFHPSFSMGCNSFLCLHIDPDAGWSTTAVIAEDGENDAIVCYFVFPRKGVAVGLRSGDVLGFNPREAHCVSARCNPDRDAFCLSLYMKAAYASGNKKEVEGGLGEEEVEWARRVKEVFKTWEREQGKRR